MRVPAPLVSALAISGLLFSGEAGAVTLEQYFFGFSDRERGVYLTGVLDLFAADSSRDPAYRQCVAELGPVGLHESLSSMVREDPRILSFDAALWIIYEASRQCNTSGAEAPVPDPRSLLPTTDEEKKSAGADVPALDGSTGARKAPAPDTSSAPETRVPFYRDWRYIGPGLAILVLLALLVAVLVTRFLKRHRPAAEPTARGTTSSADPDERLEP